MYTPRHSGKIKLATARIVAVLLKKEIQNSIRVNVDLIISELEFHAPIVQFLFLLEEAD